MSGSLRLMAVALTVLVPMLVYFLDRTNLKARGKDPSRAWVAAAAVLVLDIVVLVLIRIFFF